eukprot:1316201-Rhodomonas_salina.1
MSVPPPAQSIRYVSTVTTPLREHAMSVPRRAQHSLCQHCTVWTQRSRQHWTPCSRRAYASPGHRIAKAIVSKPDNA